MAMVTRRTLILLHGVRSARYCTSSLVDPPPPPTNPSISEKSVLEALSDLLLVDPRPSAAHRSSTVEKATRDPPLAGSLLSPGERLRGVFLWKLTGRSALDSALSSTGVDLTAEVFADVLDKWSLGGSETVDFFDWAVGRPEVSRCTATYNVMLRALGRRRFFASVDEVVARMKGDGVEADLETVEILIDSLVGARRVSEAVELFHGLEERVGWSRDADSLNIILRSLCLRSHLRVARSLFDEMKGEICFSCATYNAIIGGYAKLGRVDKVEVLLSAMAIAGLKPDQATFSHVIEALGRAGRNGEAVDVLKKMEEKGCPRDVGCYSALISNFISAGDIDEGIKYFNSMFEDHCSPNVEVYKKLIRACIKVRRIADSLELFDKMLDQGIRPSTELVTSFIAPLCRFGPPYAAMQIYEKSRKVGCVLSEEAYKLVLMRLSRFGKCGMMLKVWEDMQDSGYVSDKEVYDYLVNGLCNIGHVDKAVLVVEESLRRGFCVGKIVYSKLNNKLLDMNKVETAYRLLLKVKDARLIANAQRFWRAKGWHF